jgi:hypothetical protein
MYTEYKRKQGKGFITCPTEIADFWNVMLCSLPEEKSASVKRICITFFLEGEGIGHTGMLGTVTHLRRLSTVILIDTAVIT